MAYGKYFKKKAKQATKAVGKRYGVSYGRKGVQMKKNSVAKIAKDLMWVKSRLNVEKKFVDNTIVERGIVGQVDANGAGLFFADLTPTIAQGVAENNRVGNSVKATGMVLHMNFIKQQGATGPRRVKIMIVKSKDPGPSTAGEILDINPLSGLVDYHSNLDYTELKDKTHQVVATKYCKLAGDGQLGQVSGDTNTEGESSTATLKIPVKLFDVIRYEGNGDTLPANVRYRMIVLVDNGNRGLTGCTLPGVLVRNPLTAVEFQCHRRFWYVDN